LLFNTYVLGDDNTDKTLVSLMTVGNFCHSWIDTCTNALICEHSRKDMITGSYNLFSLAATSYGIGGISGSLLGGLFTQYLDSRYIFLTYACFTFFMIVFACNMREKVKIKNF